MDLRTEIYALDRGLDGTSLFEEAAPVSLPEQSSLVPPQGRYPAQLRQLLEKPDLGSFLQDAFVVANGDAVLSGPAQFAAALERTQAELQALVGESADMGELMTEDAECDNPKALLRGSLNLPSNTIRIIRRASRVLKRENGLRADLASYRTALLKG